MWLQVGKALEMCCSYSETPEIEQLSQVFDRQSLASSKCGTRAVSSGHDSGGGSERGG
jgi:hypothetical protein